MTAKSAYLRGLPAVQYAYSCLLPTQPLAQGEAVRYAIRGMTIRHPLGGRILFREALCKVEKESPSEY